MHDLVRMKHAAFDTPACIYLYDIVFDEQFEKIQGPRCGRVDNLAADVECRTMAGTDKSVFYLHPGNRASEMRTFTGNGQKTAVLQPAEIELSSDKCCD